MKTALEGRSKVMFSLWICPVLESTIPNQMNCKIHLILLLCYYVLLLCFNMCIYCHRTLVSLTSRRCFCLTLNYPCSKTPHLFPAPARAANFLENSCEETCFQYENLQENYNRQWSAVWNRILLREMPLLLLPLHKSTKFTPGTSLPWELALVPIQQFIARQQTTLVLKFKYFFRCQKLHFHLHVGLKSW